MRLVFALLALAPLLASAAAPLPATQPAQIKADIAALASDAMQGRETGHPGYNAAASYVANRFRSLGLAPAGNGGYMQGVPLRGSTRNYAAAKLLMYRKGKARALKFPQDFVVNRNPSATLSQVRAPAVFAGYGITAPRYGLDDYAGLDVQGKIVVLLKGAPDQLPSEERAYYDNSATETAMRHGAVAVVGIPTRASEAAFPYALRTGAYLPREGMTWQDSNGNPYSATAGLVAVATLNLQSAAQLFEGAERTYAEILDQVDHQAEQGLPRGFALPLSLSLTQGSIHRDLDSANVVGLLQGTDPLLRQEVLVLSAHLDHLGNQGPDKADRIYNGALDNAAGVATLLETARLLKAQPPRRSIVFIATTGEEKGLVGADYYARHPSVPKANIVASINLDMPMLLFDFADVTAFGAEHSSLGPSVARAAAQMGLTLSPDPTPEEAAFTRSDHYAFVQQGVPSVFVVTGQHSTQPGQDGSALWQAFMGKHYHQPSDDLQLPLDYAVGAKFALLNYLTVQDIANAPQRPSWNPGDFFGELYGGLPPTSPAR